jgi:hypothetical protein
MKKCADYPLGERTNEIYAYYRFFHAQAKSDLALAKACLSDVLWKYSKKIDTGFLSVEAKEHMQIGLIKKAVDEHFIPVSKVSEQLLGLDEVATFDDFNEFVKRFAKTRKVSRVENYKLKTMYEGLDLRMSEENFEAIYEKVGIKNATPTNL